MVKPRILTIVAFAMIPLLSFTSCVKDDDSSENPFADAVVIGEDGQTSNGSRFISCDDGSFFLNSVHYKAVDAHLAVVDCDKVISIGEVKIFPRITYKNNIYDVLEIKDKAFNFCSNITSVVIPASVVTVGRNPFYGSFGLERIVVKSGNTTYDSRNNCNAVIETATNKLLIGCKGTVIPDDVTSIGESAFSGCTGLTSIEFPEKLSSIGSAAFGGCEGLTSITIPEGVASVEGSTFRNCSGLSDVKLPSSLTSIGDFAFSDCYSLRSLTIPEGVTQIGMSAFNYCSSLASITIPEGVAQIGDYAFSFCYSLTNITIPASLTKIGYEAFNPCLDITEIHSLSMTPPVCDNDAFSYSAYFQATLYVPQGCKEAYKSASGWNEFKNIVEE